MILVEIAISFISVENARANLQAELPDLDAFDWEGMADAAEASWTAELARFEIGGALADDRRVFASNAYHFLLMPTLFTDSDGRWLGFDGEVHDDPGFTYYSDYSLWDTYRTFHPLLNLVWPEKQADFVRSMLEMAEQQGFLPIWAMLSGETHGMLGDPAAVVISDALLHDGADYGIDPARARDAMLASIPRRERWAEYEQSGYYTVDGGGGSVALTLEHAWADAALGSALALLDGDDGAEAVAARERSLRWRNHWDEESRFLRARWADGSWHEPFDPLAFEEEGYVEGNAWHYRWMLPWDDAELVTRFGSPDDFASELETFFLNASTEEPSPWPSQWYWHGNEPDIHAAFLFTSAGRPDKSGRWQRWVEDARYGLGEAGLAGNDDAGTLAAWYLFSAAGLFPLAGTERYLLGAPRWPLLRMRSGSGWLSVVGDGWSEDARTADAVAVDGEDLPDFELRWEQIRDGGELRFTMAAD
jgi:predicted alpha-1,2-mannosidase